MLQFIDHDTFPVMLKKGVLDLVYTLNPLMENPELNMIDKKEESLGFYVSPEHPLAKRRKVTEEDLEGVPLLLTSHTCSFRQMLLDDFAKHGITPTIELETSSKEILKQFAISQLGVAFMPDMVATDEIQNKKLKKLNWAGDTFPIYSQVFIHKDKHLSKAIEELITLMS